MPSSDEPPSNAAADAEALIGSRAIGALAGVPCVDR